MIWGIIKLMKLIMLEKVIMILVISVLIIKIDRWKCMMFRLSVVVVLLLMVIVFRLVDWK